MKQDLTIELDEETFRTAEFMARRRGVSVEARLANLITAMVADEARR
jgi:hypothetical protein